MLNLKKIRELRKISQQRLSDDLNISRSTVAMWETEKSQPDNDMLKKLSAYFNVSVDYLLGCTDEITPKPDSVELENDVIIYNRNGKIVKRKMSKEKMDMLASMIDAIPEDNNPDL